MDWLTFVAALTSHLAWPIAVILSVVLLRRPLSSLLPLMTKLKWKDFELQFGKALQEVKAEAVEVLPAPKVPAALPGPIEALAQVSPRAAVIEAWLEVEEAAVAALAKRGLQLHGSIMPRIMEALAEVNVLNRDELGIFSRLRTLRNQAAHAPDFAISSDEAREYAKLAASLAERLKVA